MSSSSSSKSNKNKKGSPTTTRNNSSSSNFNQKSLFSFFKKKEPVAVSTSAAAAASASASTFVKTSSSTSQVTKDNAAVSTTTTTTMKLPTVSNSRNTNTNKNKNKSHNPTNSKSKTSSSNLSVQVHVGDRIRIYWPDDRQWYAAQVIQRISGSSNNTNTNTNTSTRYVLRYDGDGDGDGDGQDQETETTDLAQERFQILSTKRKKRILDDDDDHDEEEFEFEFGQDDDEEEEEEASDFEPVDDDEQQQQQQEEEDWMVTDEEDNPEPEPPKKKKKTSNDKNNKNTKKPSSSLKVVQHSVPQESSNTPSTTTTSTNKSFLSTPLQQFAANTVSPSTSAAVRHNSHKSIPGPPPPTPSVPAVGRQTSSPIPPRKLNPAQTQTQTQSKTSPSPLPYVKNALNVAGAHIHNHLTFLQDPQDAQGRHASDPDYDNRTLKVNPNDWQRHNGGPMTHAVQQWWDLKAQYFDTVLLFKTGKFYEMFHMDADVGVQVLGLSYMKGHVAHAGFPEIAYGSMAHKLVQAGYKVARVEQTETPDQLKVRKSKTPKGKKKPSVVNREVCSIVSLGTRTFCALEDDSILNQLDETHNNNNNNNNNTQAGPLLAIYETTLESQNSSSSTKTTTTDNENGQLPAVCEYGITLVDAVRSTVTLGQFADDVLRSRLQTLLMRMAPSEILLAPDASPTLVHLIQTYQKSHACRWERVRWQETFPKSTALDPQHQRQMERPRPIIQPWDVQETLDEVHRRGYFPRASKKAQAPKSIQRWPVVLKAVTEGQAEHCLKSFGACLYFLQRHLVDYEILSMGLIQAYVPETSTPIASDTSVNTPNPLASLPPPKEHDTESLSALTNPTASATSIDLTSQIPRMESAEDQITCLSLDGTTLHNLEILTNSVDFTTKGSLWSKINHCKSPQGARYLRAWLLRPLFRKTDIDRRADAVEALASGPGAVALQDARQHILCQLGDLDRLLSRIHSMSGRTQSADDDDDEEKDAATAASQSYQNYHPNERAVLYENATYTKRKVNDFSKALNGLRKASQIPEIFADVSLDASGLLQKLVKLPKDGGCFPDMVEELDWFFDNFDCQKAAKGMFEPSRGVDALYDDACDTIDRIRADLEDYKQEMCQELSPRHVAKSSWKYINTLPDSKDKYLIELPANVQVPDDFLVKGKRGSGHKQVNKYRTSVVARLVQELERALEVQTERKAKGLQLIFAKFDSQRSLWQAAAQATAMLDALGSLAKVTSKPGYCRPIILDCPPDQPPVIDIAQGRHPCVEGSTIHTTEFIPNDLKLGGSLDEDSSNDGARLLLLSGPNMGGKSTLLRQVCLISILAQLGSYVPAESCSLTPVDCIYTRLGASDRILLGQSTFFVELAETAAALRGATRRSLVIMDELGRGTSTFDGTAIAGATVKHLVERSQCLTLFATHYHSLLDEWKEESLVRLGHMQCMVNEDEGGKKNDHSITFLYTLGPGTCPKSFGINVARLASLPAEVLDNAKRVSEQFEEEMADAHSNHAGSHKEDILAAIHENNWEELERIWHKLKSN